MIISHSRKFIFVKSKKTAGTSLEIALSKYCERGDIVGPLVPEEEDLRRKFSGVKAQGYTKKLRDYTKGELVRRVTLGIRAQKYVEHLPAWQIKRLIGADIWNSYFKFTIVRHPFDRIVSRYYYSKMYEADVGKVEVWDRNDFDQYLRYKAEQINENWEMYTEKDVPLLDYYIRYENMKEDLAEVSTKLGLSGNIHTAMNELKVKSGFRPKGSDADTLLEDKHRTIISMLCVKEMQMFGYGSEPGATVARDATKLAGV